MADRNGRRADFLERQKQRRDSDSSISFSGDSRDSRSHSGSYSGEDGSFSGSRSYYSDEDHSRSHSGSYYSDEDKNRSRRSGSDFSTGSGESFYQEGGESNYGEEDSFFASVSGETLTSGAFDDQSAAVSTGTDPSRQPYVSPRKNSPLKTSPKKSSPRKLSPKRGPATSPQRSLSPKEKSPKGPGKLLNLTSETVPGGDEEESLWLAELEQGSALLPQSGSNSSRSRSGSYSSRSRSGSYSSRSRSGSYDSGDSRSRSGSYSDRSYSQRSGSYSDGSHSRGSISERTDQLDETLNDSGMLSEQVDDGSSANIPNHDSFLSQDSQQESFLDASFGSADSSGFPQQDSYISDEWRSEHDQSQPRRVQAPGSGRGDSFREDPFAPEASFVSETDGSGFPDQVSFVSHERSEPSNFASQSVGDRPKSDLLNVQHDQDSFFQGADFAPGASFASDADNSGFQMQDSFVSHDGSERSHTGHSQSGSHSDHSHSEYSHSESDRSNEHDSFVSRDGSDRSNSQSAGFPVQDQESFQSHEHSGGFGGEEKHLDDHKFAEAEDPVHDASFASVENSASHESFVSNGSERSSSYRSRSDNSLSERSHSRSYHSISGNDDGSLSNPDSARSYSSRSTSGHSSGSDVSANESGAFSESPYGGSFVSRDTAPTKDTAAYGSMEGEDKNNVGYDGASDEDLSHSENPGSHGNSGKDPYTEEPSGDSTNAFDSFAIDSGHSIMSLRAQNNSGDGSLPGEIHDPSNGSDTGSAESFSKDYSCRADKSTEILEGSLHTVPPPECDDAEEDVSALSLLPPNTCAVVEGEDSFSGESSYSDPTNDRDNQYQSPLESPGENLRATYPSEASHEASVSENSDRRSKSTKDDLVSPFSESPPFQNKGFQDEPSITSFADGDPFLGGSSRVSGAGAALENSVEHDHSNSFSQSESASSGTMSFQENIREDEQTITSFFDGDAFSSEAGRSSKAEHAGSQMDRAQEEASCSSEPPGQLESESSESVDYEYGSIAADQDTQRNDNEGLTSEEAELQDPPEPASDGNQSFSGSEEESGSGFSSDSKDFSGSGNSSGSEDSEHSLLLEMQSIVGSIVGNDKNTQRNDNTGLTSEEAELQDPPEQASDGDQSFSGSEEESGSGFSSGSDDFSGSGSFSGSEDSEHSLLSEMQSIVGSIVGNEMSLKLPEPNTYGGYNREQMAKVSLKYREDSSLEGSIQLGGSNGKSEALLAFVANINEAIRDLVEIEEEKGGNAEEKSRSQEPVLTSKRLLYAFEALAGILLQLSDELELLLTFSKGGESPAIDALESLLDYSQTIDDTFLILKPILLHYVTTEIDEELDDFLYGMNLLLDLLCELSHRVGEKQYWNARANTAYASMLELLARDTLEVSCIYEDMDTPAYEISYIIQDAWEATGHIEEIKTLLVTTDLFMFRQICYEVILSTDQWCPDNNTLMDVCGVDDDSNADQMEPHDDDILSPPPEAALQILEKIHGDPLYRTATLASVLRRILPPQAITDPVISESYARIRNAVRNPLGMPPSSLVTITSIPESLEDPDALGVAGVGKSTLAAMAANHEDVRRFFNDGVAWIYVGETELTYNRYVQCLQDLLAQLEIDEDEEPLFPELLHCPGESMAMRRRREEGFMIYLRETIVEFLRYKNVLIVLDDVCFEPDLDWFDFSPAPLPDDEENEEDEGICAILVTSRRRNLLPPADTVEVDMLDEEEGVELLIKESGELSRALVSDAPETTSVILECACHPLAIKSVGRWLNLKHATAGTGNSMEDIHNDFVRSMDKILKSGLQEDADMMYEILNLSLSPAINGEPTSIIKLCFAAFVKVFCERKHISDFALADTTPIVPLATTELLFEALLGLEEESLKKEGSLFYAEKHEAAKLIPEALSALGVFKVIITYAEAQEGSAEGEEEDEKYLQIMHRIQQEYGEFLYEEDDALAELAKNGEHRWNLAFSKAFMDQEVEWDTESPDAGLDYALEMLPSHMIRGGMLGDAGRLLSNDKFVRGRLFALGRENGTRRHIKDCEALFALMTEERASGKKKYDPKGVIRASYSSLGGLLKMDEEEYIEEEGSPEAVEVGRCHFEVGYSLAGMRCWEGAISHWENAQEFLVSALGMVELVAGILYNVGVVYCEMHEFDQALASLKQCLRIRGAIHGEDHILYAHTIQKIGDTFLAMSDYHEAMESYDWALDVMHIEPSHHRIAIGDVLEHVGKIHYCKGEIEDALLSFQDALRSKQIDLGEDHPELASIFHQIGNCLSNQGKTDEAVAHLEEAIRLKKLDPDGGPERDSDVLTIEGILNNLNGMQQTGLRCYEQALHILVAKVPHKKEKVASLLHLIGCVYLMSGEHKKAMKLFEESLHARRKVLGFVHLDVASTLFNMAFLHQTKNRLDKALKCLEEALKIRQLRLPDSEKVAVTHEKIGNLARGIGKTKKAENAFQEALRILKIIHGNNHEAVATVLQELGDLMDDLGEFEDAMKHYVEALEIRESRLGPDDLAVAETYYSMGFTLQNTGALDRALQCLEESLSIRKFQLGDDAKDVGDTLNMMGYLQAKRGELDDALSLLWDALRIRKLQNDHIKVSETLNNIGNVHREKQEFDLAIECYEECLRNRRAELGDESEKVADALIACGNVQSDMGENEEAMESYKEALGIRNMLFGEQDESVATVLQYMGTLEFRANELDRAFQLLDEFIRIRQENGTEPDGDYVNVLFMIGNIHKMQANEEEAKKCWTEAYGVFRKLGLAETNPQIALVMSNLVKDEEVDEVTDENKSKGVLNRITAKVKSAARTANEAGNAVKRVSGMKSQDRGSQLL